MAITDEIVKNIKNMYWLFIGRIRSCSLWSCVRVIVQRDVRQCLFRHLKSAFMSHRVLTFMEHFVLSSASDVNTGKGSRSSTLHPCPTFFWVVNLCIAVSFILGHFKTLNVKQEYLNFNRGEHCVLTRFRISVSSTEQFTMTNCVWQRHCCTLRICDKNSDMCKTNLASSSWSCVNSAESHA